MIVDGILRGNGLEIPCLVRVQLVSAYSRAHQFSVIEVREVPNGTYELSALDRAVFVRHEDRKWTDGVAWIERKNLRFEPFPAR